MGVQWSIGSTQKNLQKIFGSYNINPPETMHTTSTTFNLNSLGPLPLGLGPLGPDSLGPLDNSFHTDPLNEQLLQLFEQSIFGNIGANLVPPELHRLSSLTPLGLIPEPYDHSNQRNPFDEPLIALDEIELDEIEQLFDGDLFGPDMVDLLSIPEPMVNPGEPTRTPTPTPAPTPAPTRAPAPTAAPAPTPANIDGFLVVNLSSEPEPEPEHITPTPMDHVLELEPSSPMVEHITPTPMDHVLELEPSSPMVEHITPMESVLELEPSSPMVEHITPTSTPVPTPTPVHTPMESLHVPMEEPSVTPVTRATTPVTRVVKRKNDPTEYNFQSRKVLKNALDVLHQGIHAHAMQKDLQVYLSSTVRSLTNTFNNAYTTPLSLFLPPNNGQIGTIRNKLKLQKIKILETTAATIVVEEVQNAVVQPKQWTFTFHNNEWVCGSAVLFF